MTKKPKKKGAYRKRILILVIALVVIYTTGSMVVQCISGIEMSPTLTTCFFAFCGGEVLALAGITVSKNRLNNTNRQDVTADDTSGEGDI